MGIYLDGGMIFSRLVGFGNFNLTLHNWLGKGILIWTKCVIGIVEQVGSNGVFLKYCSCGSQCKSCLMTICRIVCFQVEVQQKLSSLS